MSTPTTHRPVPAPPPRRRPPELPVSHRIFCGHCKDHHATIALVRECSQRENARGWTKRQELEGNR